MTSYLKCVFFPGQKIKPYKVLIIYLFKLLQLALQLVLLYNLALETFYKILKLTQELT